MAGRRSQSGRFSMRWIDDLGVKRLSSDSRQINRGDTFAAYPGEARDGRDYIPQALSRGAASVLWESRNYAWNPAWRCPNLGVSDLRRRAGEIASHVYGKPSAKLWMIGVTGTNGKTTCSRWIAQSLTRAGRKCGLIGTLGCGFPGALDETVNTTPDAIWLHSALEGFLKRGANAVCLEVSSHGLVQHRVSGVEFDVAMLTNFTRDHLDFHGTMRNYRRAKMSLFAWPTLKHAVLNFDDPLTTDVVAKLARRKLNVFGYGFSRARTFRAERMLRVQGRNLHLGAKGLSFDVSTPLGPASLSSALIGRFNALNLLGSLAALLASDVGLKESVAALQRVTPAPGRTERYGGGRQPLVVVDYAHSADALEKVLVALREVMNDAEPRARASRAGRLICVFGCGGERDRGKRPLMGAVASRLADDVILTSDNPRSEDPLSIIGDIQKGTGAKCAVVPDRAQAIRQAVAIAHRRDVVLIAGKGHERYQEISGEKRPFSDGKHVRAALRRYRR